jgi:hypothetical protein
MRKAARTINAIDRGFGRRLLPWLQALPKQRFGLLRAAETPSLSLSAA